MFGSGVLLAMELKVVAAEDIPCRPLKGVTTVELAEMLFYAGPDSLRVAWDELKPEFRKGYYLQAAQLIRDWPK